MKEASGELNMTVVTVVAIAAVAAFFYAFVWPSVKSSINSATKCSSAICPKSCTTGTCDCVYYEYNEDGTFNSEQPIKCKVQS